MLNSKKKRLLQFRYAKYAFCIDFGLLLSLFNYKSLHFLNLIIDKYTLHFSRETNSLPPDKTTIIFLHDSLGCVELWRDFPKSIESICNCNVLSYDRHGYGKSSPFTVIQRNNDYLLTEAMILGKILDQLSLSRVVLFGHSDGGSIALLAAALFPEKITGIITEGAHVFVEKETIKGIKEAVRLFKNTNLKERLFKYHGEKTDAVFKMWTETWLSTSYKSWNIEKYLPKIKCPSLIIQGENDEYGTLEQVYSIVKNTTGESNSLILKNVGHSPHKENPQSVIEKVNQFLHKIGISC